MKSAIKAAIKVAIVAPSGVPYAVGGAEKFWWGLLDAFKRHTRHEIELLKIPSPERNFAELIDSYRYFSELDLSHFDRVISTKYPAWMVRHEHHYVYLQHKLRGLYDTYPQGLQRELTDGPEELASLMQALAADPEPSARAAVFAELDKLRSSPLWQDYFTLPGPVARQVVHWLDQSALQPGLINKFMAISDNVAGRDDYFPAQVPVQVIRHPSDLVPQSPRPGSYLFTVSRLVESKRMGLLIQAMRSVETDIELRIAGAGPDEARLRRLAAGDDRIVFLGRVADAQLSGLYANALAVAFVPADEDYGLVTLEALQAGKPVISCTDSGGVAELITQGETGWLCEPDVTSLAACLQRLADQPQVASSMQPRCLAAGADIGWQATVNAVMDEGVLLDNDGFLQRGKPKKIVVAVSFPIFPAHTGGQNRVFNLYRHIARFTPVTLVTLCAHSEPALQREIAAGLTEIRIPKTLLHEQGEAALHRQLGVSVGDIYVIDHIHDTPQYLEALKQACRDADLAIASHPYLYPAIRSVYRGVLLYDAHNVEADMKASLFKDKQQARPWLARVAAVESQCCRDARLIGVCSSEEKARFQALYGLEDKTFCPVPNGTNIYALEEEPVLQKRIAARVRAEVYRVAVFIGSWHGPNLEAAEFIVAELAPVLPEVEFWLLGSVGKAFEGRPIPDNARLWGQVNEADKWLLLRSADIALNPVITGAGSNLKMAEYAAAGIPVLATPHGCRGLALLPEKHVHIAHLDDFSKKIQSLVNRLGTSALEQMSAEARAVSVGSHDWRGIAMAYYGQIVSVCSK